MLLAVSAAISPFCCKPSSVNHGIQVILSVDGTIRIKNGRHQKSRREILQSRKLGSHIGANGAMSVANGAVLGKQLFSIFDVALQGRSNFVFGQYFCTCSNRLTVKKFSEQRRGHAELDSPTNANARKDRDRSAKTAPLVSASSSVCTHSPRESSTRDDFGLQLRTTTRPIGQ